MPSRCCRSCCMRRPFEHPQGAVTLGTVAQKFCGDFIAIVNDHPLPVDSDLDAAYAVGPGHCFTAFVKCPSLKAGPLTFWITAPTLLPHRRSRRPFLLHRLLLLCCRWPCHCPPRQRVQVHAASRSSLSGDNIVPRGQCRVVLNDASVCCTCVSVFHATLARVLFLHIPCYLSTCTIPRRSQERQNETLLVQAQ
jgi:hypothetical protein